MDAAYICLRVCCIELELETCTHFCGADDSGSVGLGVISTCPATGLMTPDQLHTHIHTIINSPQRPAWRLHIERVERAIRKSLNP